MAHVRVLILRAAGTNCDLETEFAWERVGTYPERVHVRRLIERPELLDRYQVLMLPGGFSYGDDIAAGRILAAQITRHLIGGLRRFVAAGKLVLGICNGFQVLVRAGLLPFAQDSGPGVCSVTFNEPPGFQDRWVSVRAMPGPCVFLEPGREYELPIAHGEGRVAVSTPENLVRMERGRHAALRYVAPPPGTGVTPGAPYNPNGSVADIAGLCDETGRVLGLMPHPERFVTGTQHPCWTSRPPREDGDGLALFRAAATYFR